MDTHYEHLKFIIERFDHYYDTVNSKGSFYIGVNTFIFGGVCAGYTSLYRAIQPNFWTLFFLIAILACCILSTLLTIAAISPHLKDNYIQDDNPSLMYFGGIARYELPYLKQKFSEQSTEDISHDAITQLHSLAKGLKSKFKKIKIASYLLQAQFCLLIPLFLIIIKNLK